MCTKKQLSKKLPEISIVITTYNNEKYLQQAIESAIVQDNVDSEIIIVDDCSEDDTAIILDKYRDSKQIIAIKHQKNLGPSASRNSGIAASKGRYIAFLDADDLWLNNHLHRLLKKQQNSGGESIVVGDAIICDENLAPIRLQSKLMPFPDRNTPIFDHLLARNCINMCSILMPLKIAQKHRFNIHLTSAEDYEYWLRLSSKGVKFDFIRGEPKVLYRQHKQSLSKKRMKSIEMTETVLSDYEHLARSDIAINNIARHRESLLVQKIGCGQTRAEIMKSFHYIEKSRRLYKKELLLRFVANMFGGRAAKIVYSLLK